MSGSPRVLTVGREPLRWSQVVDVAAGNATVQLDPDPAYRDLLQRGVEVIRERIEAGDAIYGVTTGFGSSWGTSIEPGLADSLQLNLSRYHGCGVGPWIDARGSAAIVTSRLVSLARGHSGVRAELLEGMCALLEHRVLPRIPLRGSVGASGDLTPLSYVAAVLAGERDVVDDGESRPAADALAEAGLAPLALAPKEALAIMNGTAAMTGLSCLALDTARRVARWSAALTALFVDATRGNPSHYDVRIDALKPHPGQRTAAAWIRDDLGDDARRNGGVRLQDRYALRCAPHVVGTLVDACSWAADTLDVELASVDDNPIVDVETKTLLNGGNFFGGHVAMVMDTLKTTLANVAGLLDRQVILACVPETSGGLPPNLVAAGSDAAAHHGFKAMQITASALAAEAAKLTMPASVFSRSTESHNQDVVSMGMHAASDARQIAELAETTAAIATLAACQAVELRGIEHCGPRARALHAAVRDRVPMVTDDRAMDRDIEIVVSAQRSGALPIGEL